MVFAEASRRPLLAYAVLVMAALAVGYFLTSPLDLFSFAGLLVVMGLLLLPLILTYHHVLLVCAWNAVFIVFFLPGSPPLWMLVALMSLVVAVATALLVGRTPYPPARAVAMSLVLVGLVVVVTGYLRGGLGAASLGSGSYGGRRYAQVLLAIVGYFALAATPIPPARARLYSGLFMLSGLTAAGSHLIYFLGERFYFLYLFFQADLIVTQIAAEYLNSEMMRLTGIGMASIALAQFMMMRYGVRGLLDFGHPLRFLVLLGTTFLALSSGFRSVLILLALTFLLLAFFEGALFTRVFGFLSLGLLLAGAFLVPFASSLPLTVQRSLSILPLDLDPVARVDAKASTEWRVTMWRALLPDLPQYVLLGKGYAISPTDLLLSQESIRRGFGDSTMAAIVAGDYHSGPLSVYIPLGTPGVLAVLFFLTASIRLLYRHYRRGDPALRQINTFLLAAFITQTILFCLIFGALSNQFWTFTGFVGLSVSLNRGTSKLAVPEVERLGEAAQTPGRG